LELRFSARSWATGIRLFETGAESRAERRRLRRAAAYELRATRYQRRAVRAFRALGFR
jgi:hypothetical protein